MGKVIEYHRLRNGGTVQITSAAPAPDEYDGREVVDETGRMAVAVVACAVLLGLIVGCIVGIELACRFGHVVLG